MTIKNLGLVVLGLSALSTPVSAQASGRDKADLAIQKQLASPNRKGWSAVIVKTQGAPTASHEAAIVALGGDIYRHLSIINSLAVRIPNRNLAKLAALPFVSRLSSDMEVKKNDEFTVEHSGANVAWQGMGVSGTGATVAVLDSGMKDHDDLNNPVTDVSRILASVSFAFGESDTSDRCGHGTHIAGIIAGNGSASTGKKFFRTFYGVAPQANLVNVKVLNSTGNGTVSQVVSGIQWVIAKKSQYKIGVMNLSLGHPVGESYTTDPLCQAVEAAWKAGIVVVCAAGNDGRLNSTPTTGLDNEGWSTAYGSIQSPANDPYVITVGAMKNTDGNRAHDRIATYSGRGPSRLDLVMKPDIVAPGNRVISTMANNSFLSDAFSGSNQVPLSAYYSARSNSLKTSSKYFQLSGTSMATPVVSAAVALLLQKYPTLTPDTIKARLMISADKCLAADGAGDALTYGAGYLNIPAALANTAVTTQYALSPSLLIDEVTQEFYIDQSTWGNQAMWGTITNLQAIWGTQAIWGSARQALWGSGRKALWGSARQALWGSARQAIWGNQAIWGSTSSAVDLTSTAINGEK